MAGRRRTLDLLGYLILGSWFKLKRTWLQIFVVLFLGLTSFAIQHQASRPIAINNAVSEFAMIQADFVLLDELATYGATSNQYTNIKLVKAEIAGERKSLAAIGRLNGGKELNKLSKGQTARCLLALSPSPDGQRIGFKARCSDQIVVVSAAPKGSQLINSLRLAFMQNLRGVDEDSAALVAGLAIGDTSKLSANLQRDMKVVSLTHLTAVSGANCAIVLAMFYLLVRFLGGGKWVRLGVGLLALAGYVLLVGAQPSVLRAAVMAASVLVGISIGRKSAPLTALALSVSILLIADPWLAVEYGFALSVAATAGLLTLTQPLTQKLQAHLPNWFAIALAVSISAQVFCLPVLLQLQPGLSTYALPANLLAEPLVAPVTVLGIIACLSAWIFPPLAWCCTYVASEATWFIARIAQGFANSANPNLRWPGGVAGIILATCLIIGFCLWLLTKPTKLRNWGIGILTLIASFSAGSIGFSLVKSASWPLSDWSVVACDVGQGDAMVIRSANSVALIDVGRDDRLVDACLDKLAIRQIDILVLTHFDMDHIGGIRGALGGRKVGTVLVSPFKDERWGATGTNRYLAQSKIRILEVEKGMSGTLGEFEWSVLSPSRGAQGAEDSNDASIVMLWQSSTFNLLTMADIGEKGQMRMTANSPWWRDASLQKLPLVLKVSHHGSTDQYGELIEHLKPDVSLISVGRQNSYGHPTQRTINLLHGSGSAIYRTDELGSLALASRTDGLVISNASRD